MVLLCITAGFHEDGTFFIATEDWRDNAGGRTGKKTKVKSTNCQARNISVIRQQTNLKRWKRSMGYGYRWIAETAFSSIKRTFGEQLLENFLTW
jgi:hypothetical protein